MSERSTPPPPSHGLFKAHISPIDTSPEANSPEAKLEYAEGGSLAKLSFAKEESDAVSPNLFSTTTPKKKKKGGGKRNEVRGLSRQSRLRLLRELASIDFRKCAGKVQVVTLTYPAAKCPDDPDQWKRHLQKFKQRLERRYEKIPGFWRLELRRGDPSALHPHFHLLLFMDKRLSHKELTEFRGFVAKSWYEACGKLSEDHLLAGTQVKRVQSRRDWGRLTKYLAKKEELQEHSSSTGTPSDDQLVVGTRVETIRSRRGWGRAGRYVAKKEELQKEQPLPTGRVWGMWNKDLLPITWREVELPLKEAMNTRRVFRRVARAKRGRGTLHTQQVFIRNETVTRYLDWRGIDRE